MVARGSVRLVPSDGIVLADDGDCLDRARLEPNSGRGGMVEAREGGWRRGGQGTEVERRDPGFRKPIYSSGVSSLTSQTQDSTQGHLSAGPERYEELPNHSSQARGQRYIDGDSSCSFRRRISRSEAREREREAAV